MKEESGDSIFFLEKGRKILPGRVFFPCTPKNFPFKDLERTFKDLKRTFKDLKHTFQVFERKIDAREGGFLEAEEEEKEGEISKLETSFICIISRLLTSRSKFLVLNKKNSILFFLT